MGNWAFGLLALFIDTVIWVTYNGIIALLVFNYSFTIVLELIRRYSKCLFKVDRAVFVNGKPPVDNTDKEA